MRFENAYAVAAKDLREVFSDIGIYGPMLGVPLFFALTLPALTLEVALHAAPATITKLVTLPSAQLGAGYVNGIAFTLFFAINVLGPIFLTMPIFTASVIAADSLVGEKERKTSEALLSLPISNEELLLGKILASFIPAVLLTVGVFLLYGTVVNVLAYESFHTYVLPTMPWLMMIVASPLLSIAAIGLVVSVSARVKNIKEAQQISSLLVLPVLLLPFASIFGVVDLTFTFMLCVIIALAAVDVVVLYLGTRTFSKEALL
jgi:ABC-type Na+ efflux pump permease subunit